LRFTDAGANQYTGDTTVSAGTLLLEKSGGAQAVKGDLIIGDGTGGAGADVVRLAANNQIANTADVTVYSSGLLDLDGYNETFRALTMTSGSVTTGAGTLALTGGITSNAAAASATISGNLNLPGSQPLLVADGAAANDLDVSAAISGGILVKEGPGTLRLSGSTANSHVGDTMVSAGTLLLDKSGGASAVPVGLVVGDGTGGANADVARLGTTKQIADAARVLVKRSGLLDLDSHSETIGSLEIQGGSVTTGAGTLTVAGDITSSGPGGTGLISGHLDLGGGLSFRVEDGSAITDLLVTAQVANGSLTKYGPGRLDLAGSNTFTGNANVYEGVLALADAGALGSTGVINLNGGSLTLGGAPAANRVNDTAMLVFNGGDLQAESGTETFGSLTYVSDSGIHLRPDATHGDLKFGGGFRGGGVLKIFGWVGTPSVAGSDDRLFISGVLAPDVLPNIHFDGFALGAMRVPMTNEIVPVPEPSTFVLLGAGGIGLLAWAWGRKRPQPREASYAGDRAASKVPGVCLVFVGILALNSAAGTRFASAEVLTLDGNIAGTVNGVPVSASLSGDIATILGQQSRTYSYAEQPPSLLLGAIGACTVTTASATINDFR
jgi:autotransporter-associated beta strand protein